jgi:hypothetical protein
LTVTESLQSQGEKVGRTYAGILGPLGMILVIARALGNSGGVQATLWTGILTVAIMAAVGYILGELAAWIVEDSVRTKVSTELAAIEAAKSTKK